MRKFNGYERMLIKHALRNHSIALEKEVAETQAKEGFNSIFAPGFFKMTIDELLLKVDDLTLKKDLK